MHGSLNEELRFLVNSLAGIARALEIKDLHESLTSRQRTIDLLASSGLSLLGGPLETGGATSLLQMSVIVETISKSCSVADFLGTSLLAPHLLLCAGLSPESNALTADGRRLVVGFDVNLRSIARGDGAPMAAVDIGTAPHTALHLSRDGRVLLATPVPNDAQSVGEDIVRRISILETDNGIPIGDLSEVMYLSWERFGHIAVASELLGLMQGALDMTVQYASERKQFGHVIGQFQSVQHMLADCHAQVESVRSIVRSAADEQDRHGPNARLARTAKIASSEAAMSVIETCIQVHGGIGHTWEYPLHLYLRRALLDRLLLGDESTLLEDVAREILSESAS